MNQQHVFSFFIILIKFIKTMKKYIFLLSVVFFSMCSHEKSRYDIIEEKQAEQLKTGIRKDTVFMDFVYGLNRRLTFEKFRRLADDSIFIVKKNGIFEYQMILDTGKVRVGFHTGFFHDSLYNFSLILKGKNQAEAELLQRRIVNLLTEKNGNPVTVPNKSDKTKSDYYFITGNQQIEVKYPYLSNKTIVAYSDYSMEKRKNAEDQKTGKKQLPENPE